jgi:hypothetical protein
MGLGFSDIFTERYHCLGMGETLFFEVPSFMTHDKAYQPPWRIAASAVSKFLKFRIQNLQRGPLVRPISKATKPPPAGSRRLMGDGLRSRGHGAAG